jgi:uncharacterized protein (DUF433 family)
MVTYIEKREDGHWVAQSRVSLDSIVYAFLNGQTAESIAQSFPVLTLEQVYGAIAYYLANRDEIDSYLKVRQDQFEERRTQARQNDPMFYQKLADARKHMKVPIG